MVDITQPLAQWIQIGANVVLAVFTVVLAWATWRYSIAAKDQVEAQTKPYLKPATEIAEGGVNHFTIENIGNGTAHDVKIDWEIENLDGSRRSFRTPIFRPGEHANFDFPAYDDGDPLLNVDIIEDTFDDLGIDGVMVVDIEYRDSLDNQWEIEGERINIVDQLRERKNPDIFYFDDMDDYVV